MKILVFSDLHGEIDVLEKLCKIFDKQNPDLILFCGDLLANRTIDHYLIEILNKYSYKFRIVFGNCDADYCSALNDASFSVRESDEIVLGKNKICICHGHIPYTYYFNLNAGDIVLSGHTHIANFELDQYGIYHINPGSISRPRGKIKESFCVLEDDKVIFYDLNESVIMSKDFVLFNK